MKKIGNWIIIIILSILVLIFTAMQSRADNIMFAENKHQVSLSAGASIRESFENLYMFSFQYAQKNTFFGLPARQSLEIMTVQGFGELDAYSQNFILGISEDVVLYNTEKLYFGAALGAYIKSEKTDRISSKFTFGQKAFVGIKLADNKNAELYIRHLSNGSLTDFNSGQNFMGMSFLWNF